MRHIVTTQATQVPIRSGILPPPSQPHQPARHHSCAVVLDDLQNSAAGRRIQTGEASGEASDKESDKASDSASGRESGEAPGEKSEGDCVPVLAQCLEGVACPLLPRFPYKAVQCSLKTAPRTAHTHE